MIRTSRLNIEETRFICKILSDMEKINSHGRLLVFYSF